MKRLLKNFIKVCGDKTAAVRRFVFGYKIKSQPLCAEYVEDVPDVALREKVYIIEDAGHIWAAAFLCPCGCKELIHTNLMPDTKPVWKLTVHSDQTVSLNPSVWLQEGCKSHFFLTKGEIVWSHN